MAKRSLSGSFKAELLFTICIRIPCKSVSFVNYANFIYQFSDASSFRENVSRRLSLNPQWNIRGTRETMILGELAPAHLIITIYISIDQIFTFIVIRAFLLAFI